MEDVTAPRLQMNKVSRTAPLIALGGEQVVYIEGLVRLDAEFGKIEIDPSSMRVLVMQIHDDENYIFFLGVGLAVADEERLVSRMKAKATIALERGMHPTNFVDAGDEGLQALRVLNIPVTELIFL
jgi:hypothetical protein